MEDVDMPDNAPSGGKMPSGAKMPSSTPRRSRGNGAKAAVSHHDHVMNVQN